MASNNTDTQNSYDDYLHSAAFIDNEGHEIQITQAMIQQACDKIERTLIDLRIKQPDLNC